MASNRSSSPRDQLLLDQFIVSHLLHMIRLRILTIIQKIQNHLEVIREALRLVVGTVDLFPCEADHLAVVEGRVKSDEAKVLAQSSPHLDGPGAIVHLDGVFTLVLADTHDDWLLPPFKIEEPDAHIAFQRQVPYVYDQARTALQAARRGWVQIRKVDQVLDLGVLINNLALALDEEGELDPILVREGEGPKRDGPQDLERGRSVVQIRHQHHFDVLDVSFLTGARDLHWYLALGMLFIRAPFFEVRQGLLGCDTRTCPKQQRGTESSCAALPALAVHRHET
mmetsp:Transcript_66497/g.163933  ORF Transcript_66497/g.163933 Transcript_66497/m.163933 type:complete len:282 (+) Transcript_66497:2714-3559(+)